MLKHDIVSIEIVESRLLFYKYSTDHVKEGEPSETYLVSDTCLWNKRAWNGSAGGLWTTSHRIGPGSSFVGVCQNSLKSVNDLLHETIFI